MTRLPAAYEAYAVAAALALAVVATITDWREARIRNWLTLPPLLVAPAVHGTLLGWAGALASVLGGILCGLPMFLLWTKRGIGGGDVKLLAAIGVVAGVRAGLEIELMTLVVGGLYALGRVASDGKLGATLGNSMTIVANLFRPPHGRRPIEPTSMSTVRLGGASLAASALCLWVRIRPLVGL